MGHVSSAGGGGGDIKLLETLVAPGDDDRGDLAWFLSDLREFLGTELRSYPELLGQHDSLEVMLAALRDLDRIVDGAVESLRTPGGEPSTALLEQAGLTGSRLSLKLGGYRRAKGAYLSVRDRVGSVKERLGRSKAFKRFLGRANIVLGSLAAVFPPIEPFKEYKEIAEASVEERIEEIEGEAEAASYES